MPDSTPLTIQTNMTTADTIRKLHYIVSCDFRPFRWWSVTAEGEYEARRIIADQLGVDPVMMEATLAPLKGE
jgi:hypothetical protein